MSKRQQTKLEHYIIMSDKKAKKSKKVQEKPVKLVLETAEQSLEKICELSKERARKFNESVDVAINLGIDPKQSNQAVKGSLVLPNGTGKKARVVVITSDDKNKEIAKKAGAIEVGFEDLLNKIDQGFLDFDFCIATPEVMPKISKVAKKLGPRGMMPSAKNETVTEDVERVVGEFLKGKINFKNDKNGIVHCCIGKVDFEVKKLQENLDSLLKVVKSSKPEGSKGKYLKRLHLSSTMGPGIEVTNLS